MKANKDKISEEQRAQVRSRTNARIAHACSFAALVIILIDLAAFAIGQADEFYTTAGIMIAIALLAIAMLNNPTRLTPKKADDAAEADASDSVDPADPTVKK